MAGSAAGVLGVAIGGLVVAGAGAADWAAMSESESVAGFAVSEVQRRQGFEVAPLVLPLGLLGAALAVGLAAFRGRARRAVGLAAAAVGTGALAAVLVGVARAASLDGSVTVAPVVAGGGALAICAGGLAAVRRPRPPPALGKRFDLDAGDAGDADDEWRLATDGSDDDIR